MTTGLSGNALKDKLVLEFFNPCDRRPILQKLRDVFVREQVEIETDFVSVAGLIPYRFQMTVMRNASGQAMGLVSTGEPMSPPIATATSQESEKLKALKSRVVSTISHEFRTPLTTILSSSELLEKYRHKLTEEKQLKHLHKIQVAVQRLTEILNDVLTLEEVELGKLAFNLAPVNLVQFCRELVDRLQLGLPQKRLIFTHRGECTEAWLDENLLRHILSNLLSNAIKYSPNDSTVEFNVVCQESEITFEVIDRGMGIALEERMRLFESFYRGDNVGNIQGTGLGLAIVKQCVDLHGGQIGVMSEVGVGTTFTVKLPSRCGWQKLEAIAPQYLPR
jgi:signal transduction histidine kinase